MTCIFCNENEYEFTCEICYVKVCDICRFRCSKCMNTICPECNNDEGKCNICLEEENDQIEENTNEYYKKIELENNILRMENQQLKEKLKKLNKIRDKMIDNFAYEILEYFNSCKNIQQTSQKYDMDIDELMDYIIEWDGCSDNLHSAEDYEKCKIDINGRKWLDEKYIDDMSDDEFSIMMRTPEKKELETILNEYKSGKSSLYDLADSNVLFIFNLFRLLKENKLIKKENEAIGFSEFYSDYLGKKNIWNGVLNLDIINDYNNYHEYYKKIN
jgi:hypothetical protein